MANNKINHYCIICGKGYHACDSCMEIREFTPWRLLADKPSCFQIYMILDKYKKNLISKDEAREQLLHHDLREKDTYKESARKLVDEILDEPKKPRRKRPVVETVNTVIEATTAQNTELQNTDMNDCE